MNNGIFRSELECILTEKEIATYSGELARLTQEQAETENRKKQTAADYKAKLDACIATTRVIARKISTGKEMRDVEVRWDYNYRENVKTLFRLDTGEIVDTKALTESERQMCLKYEEEQEAEETPLEEDHPDLQLEGQEDGTAEPIESGQEESGEITQADSFECQDCKKRKKTKVCGADCRQV